MAGLLRVTVPALSEPSLSLASLSPDAPVPASVSPSQVSVAPGRGSPVLHAPGVRVQLFPVALRRGLEVKSNTKTFALHTISDSTLFYATGVFLQLDARDPSAPAFFAPSSSQMAKSPPLYWQKDAACSSLSQTETDRRKQMWTTVNWKPTNLQVHSFIYHFGRDQPFGSSLHTDTDKRLEKRLHQTVTLLFIPWQMFHCVIYKYSTVKQIKSILLFQNTSLFWKVLCWAKNLFGDLLAPSFLGFWPLKKEKKERKW